jgi:MFS family permease
MFATDWVQLLLLRILAGLADAIAMPALLVITSELGKDQPGKFFGILRSSQGLSYVIGPALGSAFSLVSLRTPFLADGILSMIAFAAAFRLIKDRDRIKAEHDLSVFKGIGRLLQNRNVYKYLLLGISGMFAYGILASFVPTKSQFLGLTPWQIGTIVSAGALVHSVTSYVTGTLSDRYGRKLFAILSQPVIIIFTIALIFCNGFGSILIVYCLFVVGETVPFLISFVYASETFDREYMGTSMAIFDSIIDLSLAAGPFLGILVFGISDNIAWPFVVAAVPAIICLAVSFSLPRK